MTYDAPVRATVRSQIANLAVGECYSRSERFDFDTLTRRNLADATVSMRNALAPSVKRAEEDTGNEYKVEAGEWRTHSRDIVVTVIVTRVS